VSPEADLGITKDDGVTAVVQGNPVTYTITASNATGPSGVTGARGRGAARVRRVGRATSVRA
jgi:hypothetical protein